MNRLSFRRENQDEVGIVTWFFKLLFSIVITEKEQLDYVRRYIYLDVHDLRCVYGEILTWRCSDHEQKKIFRSFMVKRKIFGITFAKYTKEVIDRYQNRKDILLLLRKEKKENIIHRDFELRKINDGTALKL